MYRTYAFAIALLLIILCTATALAYILHNNTQESSRQTERTFSDVDTANQPRGLFATEYVASHTATSSAQQPTTTQTLTIDAMVKTWKARANPNTTGSSGDVTSLRPSTQTTQQGIEDVVKSLFGPRILDSLREPKTTSADQATGELIWTGTYSGSAPTTIIEQQSKTQTALHTYGNELGSLLTTFNTTQGDQVALLDAFFKDRTSTEALRILTNNYIALSADITAIEAPAAARSIHERLSKAYNDVGVLLWALTEAKNDDDLRDSILTYNKSSEEVAKQHISLVNLFKAYGVTFAKSEPGHVFVFTAQN